MTLSQGETRCLTWLKPSTRQTQRISVYGVALAKTDRCKFHRERFGKELSNNHIPRKWETLWKQGEEQYRSMRKRAKS